MAASPVSQIIGIQTEDPKSEEVQSMQKLVQYIQAMQCKVKFNDLLILNG